MSAPKTTPQSKFRQKKLNSISPRRRLSTRPFVFFGAAGIIVALVGVVGVANASKPGDALYRVDRAAEQLQLALLSPTDGIKEAQYRRMADERIAELQELFGEDDSDTADIARGLDDFESHKAAIAELVSNDGQQAAKDIAEDFTGKESQIDKLFASRQKSLENKREALKKQLEEAAKRGDVAQVASLTAQISAIEQFLKSLEAERETTKQELEKHSEKIETHTDETTKKQNEAVREAAKQQAEVLKKQTEVNNEQAKKAIEDANEAAKRAAEDAKHAQEEAAEAEKKRLEEEKEAQESH